MSQYNYLQAIYMSFYSRKLYRDVAINWGAGVVLYLFILLALCWGVMMIKYQPVIDSSFSQVINKVTPQVPEVMIQKGIASTPEQRPYLIKDPDTKEVIAVIDTSGKYQTLNDTLSSARLLITKDSVSYMDDFNAIKTQKIPDVTINIKPELVKTKLISFVGWSWLIIFPFLLFSSFIYRLVQALVYAVLGKIFSSISRVGLTYAQVLKLSMVAITPVVIGGTILDWLYIGFHFEWLLYFVISMAYLIFAIGANKE